MSNIAQDVAFYAKALDLRAQRQQVLASNIANADTPHYKARDFDFRSAMENAVAGRQVGDGLGLRQTAHGHLSGTTGNGGISLQYRSDVQSSVDGNTVDMDVERTQIAENAFQYQLLTQLITEKFRGLRSAMAGTQG